MTETVNNIIILTKTQVTQKIITATGDPIKDKDIRYQRATYNTLQLYDTTLHHKQKQNTKTKILPEQNT